MSETVISFYKIKKFILIRNLFFLLFKISLVAIFLLLLFLFFFIVMLSIKPRKINLINNYLLEKLNKIETIDFNYNKEESFLSINSNLEIEYNIENFSAKGSNIDFLAPKIMLKINFSELFFRKIDIKNINFINANLKIISNTKNISNNNINYKNILYKIQNKIISSSKYFSIIKKIEFNNFNINFVNNNESLFINIKNLKSKMDFSRKTFNINQNIEFILNNSKNFSNLTLFCNNNKKNNKNCNIKLHNIDIKGFRNLFKEKTELYEYSKNINSVIDLEANILMDNSFNINSGNVNIFSSNGNFYLKQFFDEKIFFKNLNIELSFKNNFEDFNIVSLKTKFNNTDFFMSMFVKNFTEYTNIDLKFKAKNILLIELKKLWPNFLGEKNGVRPWVFEHVVGGKSPQAFADINIKYFKNHKKKSGLQKIYSEVKIDKILLKYDEYFPEVKDITGLAIFTEKDMNININSGKVLDSVINDANISINFNKNIKDLNIKANVKGPFSDLFVHIDKKEKKLIEASVNNIISDIYTNSNLKINIPIIDNLDFRKVSININSNILNKTNYIFKNSSNILVSFIKERNSNKFSGTLNFDNIDIEFIPLNIVKKSRKKLAFNYGAEIINNNNIKITKFVPLVDYLKFSLDGYINLDKKEQEINLKNIEYNNSKYNLYYTSYTANNKLFNNIIIDGNNVNYSNILDRIKNIKIKKYKENKEVLINNELSIKANLNYINFTNNNKLYQPTILVIFKNNKIDTLDTYAKINNKKFVNISLNKKKNIFKVTSNDFGKFFSTIELTNSIINSGGTIELNLNKNNIITGKIDIIKTFTILPDENIKKDVLEDVDKDKNFKELRKKLKRNKGITFDRMKGDFSYSNGILNFKEIVASSKYIGFQILASGFINMDTNSMKIKGLFVPLGFINGLFGINKLPLISDVIFGQKNAGLFASKFEINKNKNKKLDIKINKFSMILPGFLRNIITN